MSDTPTIQFIDKMTMSQNQLYAYILSLIGNVEDAHDVLQEVNQTVLQKAEDFRSGTDFSAWVCKIAFFKVQSFWRDKGREKVLFSSELMREMASPLEEILGEYDVRLEALQECLKKLPAEKRKMLRQRYHESMSISQLANFWSRSYKATVAMLSRVRLRLLDCIEKEVTSEGQR